MTKFRLPHVGALSLAILAVLLSGCGGHYG